VAAAVVGRTDSGPLQPGRPPEDFDCGKRQRNLREPEAGPGWNFIVSRNLPEATAHPQLEPRRKQVALLFADIVDSTELVATLGDES
jgi:class 3 adenylate cyclase